MGAKVILNVRSTKINTNKWKLFAKNAISYPEKSCSLIRLKGGSDIPVSGSSSGSIYNLLPTYITSVKVGRCCCLQVKILPPANQTLKSRDNFSKMLWRKIPGTAVSYQYSAEWWHVIQLPAPAHLSP